MYDQPLGEDSMRDAASIRGSIACVLLACTVAACSGTSSGVAGSTATDGGTGSGSGATDGGTGTGSAPEECDWNAVFEEFYAQDHVVDIRIDFDDPTAYAQMLDAAREPPIERPFFPATVTIDGESMSNVGVRLKGNSSLWTSRDDQMKSFKIHFEEYVEGQRFHCIDRVSLNSNFKDPSIMRERLAYALANEYGIDASRTAYAEVHVEGDRHGVYTMIQQVNHRFLRERFGTEAHADDGNLYKCYQGCPLVYMGEDAEAYKAGMGGMQCDDPERCGLQLKTNEDDPLRNDYADIALLTRTIDDFRAGSVGTAELEAVFDVEHYLRFQAWNLVLSNLDSYYVPVHNFYLYHRVLDDRFQMIPWDVNEAYGAFPCRGEPGQPPPVDVLEVDLVDVCGDPLLPLTEMVAKEPAYTSMYCEALHDFMDTIYDVADQDSRIAALHALVGTAREQPSVKSQPPEDYSYDEYLVAQTHEPPAGPGPGMGAYNLGFFNDRRIEHVEAQIAVLCQ
jgi:hypothetical protein